MTLELRNQSLHFSFPEVHPGAQITITFQRTLRIPDDDKTYPLPPGLGNFPLQHVDDFKDRVPAKWNKHGGVMIPLYQSEALWLQFTCHTALHQGVYPFAIKVATGKRSALTGKAWSKSLKENDYCVAPKQPWLDGYVVDGDTIRQFVAAPLGMGFSAEEQITGKAEYGGLQIEVIPMKAEVFNKRFPKRSPPRLNILRSHNMRAGSASGSSSFYSPQFSTDYLTLSSVDGAPIACAAASMNADMGLAPGGKMKQQVFEDPYKFTDWDTDTHGRCFVHLANSLVWRAITKQEPPTTPMTAEDYTRHGYPWFDLYEDGIKSLKGTKLTKGLSSVMKLGFQKGFSILPENQPVSFKSDQVKKIGQSGEVRDGKWL